jgi:imidazolonepropionase
MTRIGDAALVTRAGMIEWVGPLAALPRDLASSATHRVDLSGRWVTPGLIDCHTHLIFGGNRSAEFAERLRGTSYADIARRGGGILSTVRATRAASDAQLTAAALRRLDALLAEGVTTVEIKSGYGLTEHDERRMLHIARELGRARPVRVRTTFLGAHALPEEYAGRAGQYVADLAETWLPRLAAEGLVDAVDVFCEHIGFSVDDAQRVFASAQRLGLPVKMHAEQLSNVGGSRLACRYSALSCDHLEFTTPADVAALAAAGTTAVLLPIAFYSLRETRRPPVPALREQRVPMAVATDCNPGSAPTASLLLAMNMAVQLFGLTSDEALAGATRCAARALGLQTQCGELAPGLGADFAVWDVESPDELCYWAGFNPLVAVVRGGGIVRGMSDQDVRVAHD